MTFYGIFLFLNRRSPNVIALRYLLTNVTCFMKMLKLHRDSLLIVIICLQTDIPKTSNLLGNMQANNVIL